MLFKKPLLFLLTFYSDTPINSNIIFGKTAIIIKRYTSFLPFHICMSNCISKILTAQKLQGL